MNEAQALAKCLAAMAPEVRRATVYIDAKTCVSLCRRFKYSKRNTREDFVVKVGRVNYEQAEFVKRCKRAGEPLPVKRVQLKFWPAKP